MIKNVRIASSSHRLMALRLGLQVQSLLSAEKKQADEHIDLYGVQSLQG